MEHVHKFKHSLKVAFMKLYLATELKISAEQKRPHVSTASFLSFSHFLCPERSSEYAKNSVVVRFVWELVELSKIYAHQN